MSEELKYVARLQDMHREAHLRAEKAEAEVVRLRHLHDLDHSAHLALVGELVKAGDALASASMVCPEDVQEQRDAWNALKARKEVPDDD